MPSDFPIDQSQFAIIRCQEEAKGFPCKQIVEIFTGYLIVKYLVWFIMSCKFLSLCALLFYVITVLSANQDTVNKNVEITKAQRTVDLSSHLPEITSVLTFENKGSSSVQNVLLAVDPALYSKLSYISASVSVLCFRTRGVAMIICKFTASLNTYLPLFRQFLLSKLRKIETELASIRLNRLTVLKTLTNSSCWLAITVQARLVCSSALELVQCCHIIFAQARNYILMITRR